MSTGPKTEEGKTAVRLNAVKHGILFQGGLLPYEDPDEFAEFVARFYSGLKPVGELEILLVDRIVFSAWRLRRLMAIEGEIIKDKLAGAFDPESFSYITFSRLSRYETAVERSLYKTLHELERHQTSRHGELVQAPLVVDIHSPE